MVGDQTGRSQTPHTMDRTPILPLLFGLLSITGGRCCKPTYSTGPITRCAASMDLFVVEPSMPHR